MSDDDRITTVLVVDLFGPIIDISKIPKFSKIPNVRFLSEEEIANQLNEIKNTTLSDKKEKWCKKTILNVTTEALKDSKISYKLIDYDIIRLICQAKMFCKIFIVSSVDNEYLFNIAKELLINYTTNLLPLICTNQERTKYKELSDDDFLIQGGDKYRTITASNKEKFLIIFDDDSYLAKIRSGGHYEINEWICGVGDSDPAGKLSNILSYRKHIYDSENIVKDIITEEKIELSNYKVLNEFLVFNTSRREKIKSATDAIVDIINNGTLDPLCVFLAGSPGTGKSFFVKCFINSFDVKKIGHYTTTSLSGVSSNRFSDAVGKHIESIYAKMDTQGNRVTFAFTDEVDTKGEYFAFRLLMDAMTGTKVNDDGTPDNSIEKGKLIWFFAGSGGVTRADFIDTYKDDGDRKVVDFFDRIHIDIKLPSVLDNGQTILFMLNSIKKYVSGDLPSCIDSNVLRLFSYTRWTSARQIETICRVAMTRIKNKDHVSMEMFKGIDLVEGFSETIDDLSSRFTEQRIRIRW